jgi:hypothetical protein
MMAPTSSLNWSQIDIACLLPGAAHPAIRAAQGRVCP